MATMRAPRVPTSLASATERMFMALSGARRRRIFHPQGIAFSARFSVDAGLADVPVLRPGVRGDVIVRFSRALGTPRGSLDFLGIALRIGQEQDLLLASSSPAAVLRYLPLPARTFAGTTFSSLLPFQAGGRVFLAAARVHHAQAALDDQLAELAAAATVAPVAVVLAVAEIGGPWRRCATAEVGDRLGDDEASRLAFDPWICDGGLVPWGAVNALRAPAYRGSRRGRRRAGTHTR